MAKFRVEAEFYCYIDDAGMQKHVINKAALETEEDDQEELESDKEDPFAPGKVFSSMGPESKEIVDYFKITSVEGNSVKCRDAKHDADYVFTKKQMAEDLIEGRLNESIQKLYDAMMNGEDRFPVGTIFAVFHPDKRTAYNYVEVKTVVGSSMVLRSAEDKSEYTCTEEEALAKINANEFRVTIGGKTMKELYEGLSLSDEPEETEAPISADETTVEDEVKKQISELVGHLDRPLILSGTDNGIWSGKKIGGDMEICKDEVHDLLDNEARGLRAVFVVTLMDKK